MLILGIESSCDETGASVVRDGRTVLSNVIASQHDLHAEYGGVVPEIASRAHVERIMPVLRRALDDAGVTFRDIDAIAVGHRPGLIGALLVGVSAAKALAWSLDTPIVGIDHVQAHLYAGLLDDDTWSDESVFPALGLVVSGGHTAMYLLRGPLDVMLLGKTIDDAIGEAFDKVSSMLGLGHPGGPAVDRLARTGDERAHDFPVSRLSRESLDFSYSGLKTAVLYEARGKPNSDGSFERDGWDLDERMKANLCASFERAAVRAITLKIERALDATDTPVRTLLVGGGVSANTRLRAELESLARARELELRLPRTDLCLDNAAMLAGLAHRKLERDGGDWLGLVASPMSAIR
ncbi:MAG: tRNA (adenosine(37)-N6)-threonylcarbamoyltransferase complex transferase subunit TsaD [Planctomycetota bacterium]